MAISPPSNTPAAARGDKATNATSGTTTTTDTNPANNVQPLYRFYNVRNGSHFYTASATERDHVIATWSSTFHYDGPTYLVNTASVARSTPVYRFFNLTNGSHFYTASATERDHVMATWSTVYRLEGTAFWIGQ